MVSVNWHKPHTVVLTAAQRQTQFLRAQNYSVSACPPAKCYRCGAAVAALVTLGGEEALDVIDRGGLLAFLRRMAVPAAQGGGFRMCHGVLQHLAGRSRCRPLLIESVFCWLICSPALYP